MVLSKWSTSFIQLSTWRKTHWTISACLEKQLPANEIKISQALDISLKHIYFLTAKYSPLALSYLLASPLSSLSASLLLGAQLPWLSQSVSSHPLPSFWQVLALIRSVNTLWRSSKGLRGSGHGAGWSCQGPGECQSWRMLTAPWHTCVDGRSPIWVCKAIWNPHEILNKPLFFSLCGLEGGELCLPCAWCCMDQVWTRLGDSLCPSTGQNCHNSLQDNLVWEVFDLF